MVTSTFETDDDCAEGYESGPFCQHWDSAPDCTDLCVCGHECRRHYRNGDCDFCECEKFEDPN